MKRFLIFSGSTYYPIGGMHDFKGDVSYLSKARALAVKEFEPDNGYVSDGWAHVYDTRTREVVAAWKCRGSGMENPATIEEIPRDSWEFDQWRN